MFLEINNYHREKALVPEGQCPASDSGAQEMSSGKTNLSGNLTTLAYTPNKTELNLDANCADYLTFFRVSASPGFIPSLNSSSPY